MDFILQLSTCFTENIVRAYYKGQPFCVIQGNSRRLLWGAHTHTHTKFHCLGDVERWFVERLYLNSVQKRQLCNQPKVRLAVETCRPGHAAILVAREVSVLCTEVAKCVAAFWGATEVNLQVLWGVPPFLRCSFRALFYLLLSPLPRCLVRSWQNRPKRTCATVRLVVCVGGT